MARIPCPFDLCHSGLFLATIDCEAQAEETGDVKFFVQGLEPESFTSRKETKGDKQVYGERELEPDDLPASLYGQCKAQFKADPRNGDRLDDAVYEAKRGLLEAERERYRDAAESADTAKALDIMERDFGRRSTAQEETMPEYIFKGTMKVRDVAFLIEADNEKDAKALAEQGKYSYWDMDTAETTDVEIDPNTIELNE